jgi:hypothetical protein
MPNPLTEPADHRRCTARANRSGQRCKRAAIASGTVCPTHGGRAPAVKRRAAERVALEQVRGMLGAAEDDDPRRVILAAVKACNALLNGAQAAVAADDADAGDLAGLSAAAVTVARVAKLALDADLEASFARQDQRAGEVVAAMVTAVVNGLDLPPGVAAAAFRLVRSEVESGRLDGGRYVGLSVAELDVEIGRVVAELDAADARDAVEGFPVRLARTLDAALGALDLDDDQRERALAAAEAFLAEDARERADRERTRLERAGVSSSGAWWIKPATLHGNGGNGGGWR